VGSDLLSGLDQIDWASLTHAFGPAVDVPGWLRGLIDPDPERRACALDALSNAIWHQGTVYAASPHVVPFLGRMLRAADTPDRRLPAFLLGLLADGSSYLDVHAAGGGVHDEQVRAWVAGAGRDLETELARERAIVDATREAVGSVVIELAQWLHDADPGLREVVALALGRYPDRAGELVPLLRQALARERDPDVRDVIEAAVRDLEGGG
jgi:hypothetical protein